MLTLWRRAGIICCVGRVVQNWLAAVPAFPGCGSSSGFQLSRSARGTQGTVRFLTLKLILKLSLKYLHKSLPVVYDVLRKSRDNPNTFSLQIERFTLSPSSSPGAPGCGAALIMEVFGILLAPIFSSFFPCKCGIYRLLSDSA